ITEVVTCNLNRVIDVNYYPTESARRSNMRHRPIGLGVQGLADAFILLGMPFDSPQARQLNQDIFETIYYHALRTSCQLAKEEGTYESYAGCPVSKVRHAKFSSLHPHPLSPQLSSSSPLPSLPIPTVSVSHLSSFPASVRAHGLIEELTWKGVFQPDMWGVTPSDRWVWAALRADIAAHGLRNSLLVAPIFTSFHLLSRLFSPSHPPYPFIPPLHPPSGHLATGHVGSDPL
ncbi:unnamed protein product, partial [Closterium sp. NIES-54]